MVHVYTFSMAHKRRPIRTCTQVYMSEILYYTCLKDGISHVLYKTILHTLKYSGEMPKLSHVSSSYLYVIAFGDQVPSRYLLAGGFQMFPRLSHDGLSCQVDPSSSP